MLASRGVRVSRVWRSEAIFVRRSRHSGARPTDISRGRSATGHAGEYNSITCHMSECGCERATPADDGHLYTATEQVAHGLILRSISPFP